MTLRDLTFATQAIGGRPIHPPDVEDHADQGNGINGRP